jgi:hypothetical protein
MRKPRLAQGWGNFNSALMADFAAFRQACCLTVKHDSDNAEPGNERVTHEKQAIEMIALTAVG